MHQGAVPSAPERSPAVRVSLGCVGDTFPSSGLWFPILRPSHLCPSEGTRFCGQASHLQRRWAASPPPRPAGSVRGGPRLPCRPRTGGRGQGLCPGCERWPAGGCVVMIVPGEGEDLVQPQPLGQLSQGAFWARGHRCRSGPGVRLCPGNTVCFLWAQGAPLRRMNE